MLNVIEKVLDEYVRPKLIPHEGNIEVINYENNIVKVRFLGKCSHCPSATVTVKILVEEEIKKHIEGIEEVILFEGVSDDLINYAKQFMKCYKA
ncbi:NifU family protein [Alloiococcus sp. CFN-8]|uniref:NifU family protein n=1 Tax=Alloiococcus sp. CFN-8 TaxID=3416081 RepID=UPI003CED65B0